MDCFSYNGKKISQSLFGGKNEVIEEMMSSL